MTDYYESHHIVMSEADYVHLINHLEKGHDIDRTRAYLIISDIVTYLTKRRNSDEGEKE